MNHEKGFSKKYGQIFLKNKTLANLEARLISGAIGNTVLEIGPGQGMLTRELLDAGYIVTAVESDHRYVSYLDEHFREDIEKKPSF
ncbi:dimethyladenosine transferase [mine drainage metagenome]|uniref:Dimethyladenosine transferase n=1 Tax=mine drainage metagenome TaxID=410659 RepID=T0ZFM0_9ZZZZ